VCLGGKNNGTVDGIQYFHAPDNHGLFCRTEAVTPLEANARELVPPKSSRELSITEDFGSMASNNDPFPIKRADGKRGKPRASSRTRTRSRSRPRVSPVARTGRKKPVPPSSEPPAAIRTLSTASLNSIGSTNTADPRGEWIDVFSSAVEDEDFSPASSLVMPAENNAKLWSFIAKNKRSVRENANAARAARRGSSTSGSGRRLGKNRVNPKRPDSGSGSGRNLKPKAPRNRSRETVHLVSPHDPRFNPAAGGQGNLTASSRSIGSRSSRSPSPGSGSRRSPRSGRKSRTPRLNSRRSRSRSGRSASNTPSPSVSPRASSSASPRSRGFPADGGRSPSTLSPGLPNRKLRKGSDRSLRPGRPRAVPRSPSETSDEMARRKAMSRTDPNREPGKRMNMLAKQKRLQAARQTGATMDDSVVSMIQETRQELTRETKELAKDHNSVAQQLLKTQELADSNKETIAALKRELHAAMDREQRGRRDLEKRFERLLELDVIQYALAERYRKGEQSEEHLHKACEWYRLAAEQGHTEAMHNLGFMFANGIGAIQDLAVASHWFMKAAEQDHEASMCNLGVMYRHGRGVEQDYSRACMWYERAALKGHAQAMKNLGFMYDAGHGVSQSDEKAFYWYEMAGRHGNAGAQNNLASLYHNGRGVTQDYSKACEWFERAALQGDAVAMANLGVMYYNGQGVDKNLFTAKMWFERAAELGHSKARKRLSDIIALLERQPDLANSDTDQGDTKSNGSATTAGRSQASGANRDMSESGSDTEHDDSDAHDEYQRFNAGHSQDPASYVAPGDDDFVRHSSSDSDSDVPPPMASETIAAAAAAATAATVAANGSGSQA
jgi:TPR repeat protein